LIIAERKVLQSMRYVIVGTAGHIDHGKSALVKALTGTDPDRLKEEKLRGITIDLGFAHLDLTDLQVGFVDVPGHERFVKNMLAGVGGIDLVLLVVAADESVMPQTREHFDICRLLEINSGLVVITKIDLVEPDLVQLVREEISDLTRGSSLEDAEVIPVSSKTGSGISDLKTALRRLALSLPERPQDRLPRLPVDRAFTVRGFGTVVTGTLTAGQIAKDQEVELIPGNLTSRVRGIQVHGKMSERAVAGQRTAVNLQGLDLAHVERGMVLTAPRLFRSTQMVDVRLDLLTSAPRPLKNLVKVRFHHGTSEVLARVALLGVDSLAPGESANAQLRLEAPVFCLHNDLFIIRQFSPTITIGGGKVLNSHPVKHKITDRNAVFALRALDKAPLEEKILGLIAAAKSRAMSLEQLNSLVGFAEPKLMELCSGLASSQKLTLIPGASPILVLPETVERLKQEVMSRTARFHRENPLQRGISREELRNRLFSDLPADFFRFCLDALVKERKVSLQEDTVSLFGREIQLDAQSQHVRQLIEEVFQRAGYQPPAISDLSSAVAADPEEVRKIYFWMVKEKILVKISDDLAYHRETLEEIKSKIHETYARGSTFGVAEFKDMFDLTRKHAIPLLEFLDRERFTRRQGNERILL
jgi:selenocysteine-specific elongation factor